MLFVSPILFLTLILMLSYSLALRCTKSSDAPPAHGPAKLWVSKTIKHNHAWKNVGGILRKARPETRRAPLGTVLQEQVSEELPYAFLDRYVRQMDIATRDGRIRVWKG